MNERIAKISAALDVAIAKLEAAKCPLCDGDGEVIKAAGLWSDGRPQIVQCPACDGSGSAAPPRLRASGQSEQTTEEET